MTFDAIIANPGRLRILTALANAPRQEFVQLRSQTQMTDGNLATHAKRLHSAGMLAIDKTFRDGKPVTTYALTRQGRGALEAHVENLMLALKPRSTTADPAENEDQLDTIDESNWID